MLQWGGLLPPGPHRVCGRITAKHRVNELMSENAQGVILDGTVPENNSAEHCATKSWALGLSVNTSKAELPCGFKRPQLPSYKSRQCPRTLLWAGAAKYPHL